MITRHLTRQQVEAEPYRVWNAFIDLIAMEKYADLSAVQRPPHLVFLYESDVQNGGHENYFDNRGMEHLEETIEALGLIGAVEQQRLLWKAGQLKLSELRLPLPADDDYDYDSPIDDEIHNLDLRFYACSPGLCHYLEEYLAMHQSSFVIVE